MPRLSLYRPEKGNDYKFLDRTISEMFQVGGADIYIHKYIGTGEGDDFKDLTQIQDLLFLENRDRKYDDSIYRIRGIYNVQDIDFNLSQFGLFIDNDTLFLTVHINDYIRSLGRKPLNGDVIEIPNLKDEFALSDFDVSLPRYYVISDVGRAAEGFSPTWYPHLYRLKLTKILDSQQYKDIFDQKVIDPVTGEETDNTLRDLLSTQDRYLQVNDGILAEANANTNTAWKPGDPGTPIGKSGYETQHFYTLAVDNFGNAALETVDETTLTIDETGLDVSRLAKRPTRTGYTGYLLGDGIPPNGVDFGHGITFPSNAYEGDYFLRTDFFPNRLFRFDGSRWVKREDKVRMTLTNEDPTKAISNTNPTRQTQRGSFINNNDKTGVNLLKTDVVTTTGDTIVTNVTFVVGMYATVATADSPFLSAPVMLGTGNIAVIELSTDVAVGTKIEYKLYEKAISERQSLSTALKPRADL
jgi:hypothetical protein